MTATRRRRERPRVTPREVTAAVVIAAVRALEMPTAAAVAEAIGSAGGMRVSGRAVRFIAEGAGILHEEAQRGARRYWIGLGLGDVTTEVAVRDALRDLATRVRAGRLRADTFQAAAERTLDALAGKHPGVAGPQIRAEIVDRTNDLARLQGWPLVTAPGGATAT